MSDSFSIRPAEKADKDQISRLANSGHYVHRHLDWHVATDWLGQKPFWVATKGKWIKAALACPPLPVGIAWVRVFAVSMECSPSMFWDQLFPKILEEFNIAPVEIIPAIAVQDWFAQLLLKNGFEHFQDVVVLKMKEASTINYSARNIHIRRMTANDLDRVIQIDKTAFVRLWQLPEEAFRIALEQSFFSAVAELESRIVGYQITTASLGKAHLARLAVVPEYQNQHVGGMLVSDLLHECKKSQIHQLTVNTQNDNRASLALYGKCGFFLTGEKYPVLQYKGF